MASSGHRAPHQLALGDIRTRQSRHRLCSATSSGAPLRGRLLVHDGQVADVAPAFRGAGPSRRPARECPAARAGDGLPAPDRPDAAGRRRLDGDAAARRADRRDGGGREPRPGGPGRGLRGRGGRRRGRARPCLPEQPPAGRRAEQHRADPAVAAAAGRRRCRGSHRRADPRRR